MINPYWDAVAQHVTDDDMWGRVVGAPPWYGSRDELDRDDLVGTYSWTITDPGTVEFVAKWAGKSMIDPMAGTGYWGYLLDQLGVDITCSDRDPVNNVWHEGKPLFVPVDKVDGAVAVEGYPDRTLLLSWPPYNLAAGYDILSAYKGERVVYIGEDDGGCTGDRQLHDALSSEWVAIRTHRPVQWFGVHDMIIVYQRKGEENAQSE